MKRNIFLVYILSFCFSALFWIGIWLLYYLRFTNYAGVGLVESAWITLWVLGEVPTGAVADLIGRKKTLMLAMLLGALGEVIMALVPSYGYLFFGVLIVAAGKTLYSGAFEALLFDSLKELKQSDQYQQILAHTQTIGLIASAIASALGGFLYAVKPGLPFLVTGIFFFLGFVATLFLTEPHIDTVKFSWKSYWFQTRQGFNQLFKPELKKITVQLLAIGVFTVILYNILGDSLVLAFGFRDKQLGIFYAGLFLLSALLTQLAPIIKRHFSIIGAVRLTTVVYTLTLITAPILGLISGGLSIYLRAVFFYLLVNLTSEAINRHTESRHRATTLSTFNMLQNFPYMLSAFFIGNLIDWLTVRTFAFYFGLVLAGTMLIVNLFPRTAKSA